MGTNDKEIIDLTGEHEVIVLESDMENSSPAKARDARTANGRGGGKGGSKPGSVGSSPSGAVTRGQTPGQEVASSSQSKPKKPRRKKKRKSTVVKEGGEEGELVEEESAAVSVEVSREPSTERTPGGSGKSSPKGKNSAKKNKAKASRAPSPELADATDEDEDDGTDDELDAILAELGTPRDHVKSKAARKRERKRKRRDKVAQRDQEAGPSRKRSRSPQSPKLFFVDDKPAEIPPNVKYIDATQPAQPAKPVQKAENDEAPLLLPAHVSVLEDVGDTPIEIIQQPAVDSDDDYIEYLDYDDDRRLGVKRYFDDPEDTNEVLKATRMVCKHCGAEGEHRTYECPVVICLTCGARDEHTTRGCPISKTCYTCGMRGHINRDCPNRRTGKAFSSQYDDCDRCGSTVHKANECPTLWRMYEYVDDAERQTILTLREEKRDFLLGQGGEGYIAPEDWCYNCGECGHLGDDCTQPFPHDHLKEPSAFSEYNCLAGPFFDAQHTVKRAPGKAATYARQTEEAWGDGAGHLIPLDVGKKGRRKERTRLEQKAQQSRDDEDDWFARRGGGGGGSGGGGRGGGRSGGERSLLARLGEEREPRKMTFGLVVPGRQRPWYDSLPPPMLASESLQIRGASRRDEWDGAIRGASSRNGGGGSGRRDRDYEREYERERDRDRNRSYGRDRKNDGGRRDRRSPERRRDREASPRREPRYRGGYAR